MINPPLAQSSLSSIQPSLLNPTSPYFQPAALHINPPYGTSVRPLHLSYLMHSLCPGGQPVLDPLDHLHSSAGVTNTFTAPPDTGQRVTTGARLRGRVRALCALITCSQAYSQPC